MHTETIMTLFVAAFAGGMFVGGAIGVLAVALVSSSTRGERKP